jgi:glycosyltransferase involved in cell wall biosynthesis
LFAGRLAPEKNLGAVVEAAEALPEMRFMVAGDGPLRQWLTTQAERLPNLEYIGWVKRPRILPLIDDVDALVLPSTVESFGTIALEAMARGRLVVVSSQCGILSWNLLKRGLFQMREDEPCRRPCDGCVNSTTPCSNARPALPAMPHARSTTATSDIGSACLQTATRGA